MRRAVCKHWCWAILVGLTVGALWQARQDLTLANAVARTTTLPPESGLAVSSPSLRLNPNVNDSVWLLLAPSQRQKEYMFVPLITSLEAGFAGLGVRLQVCWARDSLCDFMDALYADRAQNITPIVIAMQWFLVGWPVVNCAVNKVKYRAAVNKTKYGIVLREIANMSYLILYNDEPKLRVGDQGERFVKKALQHGAREVWTYSKYIMSLYRPNMTHANITSRYLPPGCASQLDFGFQLSSTHQTLHRDYSHLGFLGAWQDRPAATKQKVASLLPNLVVIEDDATSLLKLQQYLQDCPLVQLNLHSFRNPVGEAFEAFRASVLLLNGACLISEPTHPLDQQMWDGIVHFVNISEIPAAFEPLQGNELAVRSCNQRSRRMFCERFKPVELLQDSGFPKVLAELFPA